MLGNWMLNQANTILFVMVDAAGAEVSGLGAGLSVEISKGGGAFAAGAGATAEIGDGWYRYLATAGEADTAGPVAVKVTGAGAAQQNLEYTVIGRTITAVEFTYTVTSSLGGAPIEGAQVWFSTDAGGGDVVWAGVTDAFGVARDTAGNLPRMDPGTYFVWRQRAGFIFANPDTEVVSA